MLDSRLQRESNYTRKNCVTTTAEHEYINALGSSTGAQLQVPNFEYEGGEKDKDNFVKEVKLQASSNLKYRNELKWKDHIKTLVQQGNFLDIASAQHEDIIWKYMKQGTLKFLLNASLDTLPTNANLFKWNKKTSDKCKQCKCRETTSHILNGCRVALESGKFLWRHNSIINYILQCVDTEKFTAYADLPGYTADGCGTVPPDTQTRLSHY